MSQFLKDDFKAHYIRAAGTAALLGNIFLAATKIILGRLSGSLAIFGDGIDSCTDAVIAVVTLAISGIIMQPSDSDHPWGHGRAETTATLLLSFIIFFAGAQLVLNSIISLIHGTGKKEISFLAVTAALISIAGKSILALTQYHFARIADSEIIRANAENMKSDIMLSAGVLAGISAARFFNCAALDPIVACLVGLWVVKNALNIFREINLELMDGNTDNSLYKKLFEAVSSVNGVANPHRARIRKIAGSFDIDLDIEVDPAMTVFDAHELSEQVEDAVHRSIPEVYDIVVHIEPHGSDSHQPKEQYGLSPNLLAKSRQL